MFSLRSLKKKLLSFPSLICYIHGSCSVDSLPESEGNGNGPSYGWASGLPVVSWLRVSDPRVPYERSDRQGPRGRGKGYRSMILVSDRTVRHSSGTRVYRNRRRTVSTEKQRSSL